MSDLCAEKHREWVEKLAKLCLSRPATEFELRTLGIAPWEAAWKACSEQIDLNWQKKCDALEKQLCQELAISEELRAEIDGLKVLLKNFMTAD